MRVELTPEEKATCEEWGRERQARALKMNLRERRAYQGNDPAILHVVGVFGEFTAWKAFRLGPEELERIRLNRPEQDARGRWSFRKDGGLDLRCPSGHTVQAKCPTAPGGDFLLSSTNASDFTADFAVVVDFMRGKWDYAILAGWVSREGFLAFPHTFGPPEYLKASLGQRRDNFNRLGPGAAEPLWVRTRTRLLFVGNVPVERIPVEVTDDPRP